MQTKGVRAHHTIIWTGQDYPTWRWRGRQRKQWEDNIKEWTGLEWNILLRKAENCKEWRKLVVKSTVVAQRSARLQDRSDKIRSALLVHGQFVNHMCPLLILLFPLQTEFWKAPHWWDFRIGDRLATVQVVTVQLQVMVPVAEVYGKKCWWMASKVERQWKHRTMEGRKQRRNWIRKRKLELISSDCKAGDGVISLGQGLPWAVLSAILWVINIIILWTINFAVILWELLTLLLFCES